MHSLSAPSVVLMRHTAHHSLDSMTEPEISHYYSGITVIHVHVCTEWLMHMYKYDSI